MNRRALVSLAALVAPAMMGFIGGGWFSGAKDDDGVSFTKDVHPIIRKHCLPCHAEESYNPSELALDTYALLMVGGKHGKPVVPGEPGESILLQKLQEDPPFGERMPLQKRRRKNTAAVKRLTDEQVELLRTWVMQGGKDN